MNHEQQARINHHLRFTGLNTGDVENKGHSKMRR